MLWISVEVWYSVRSFVADEEVPRRLEVLLALAMSAYDFWYS